MGVGVGMDHEATGIKAIQRKVRFWSLGSISLSELLAAVGILGIMVGLIIGVVG